MITIELYYKQISKFAKHFLINWKLNKTCTRNKVPFGRLNCRNVIDHEFDATIHVYSSRCKSIYPVDDLIRLELSLLYRSSPSQHKFDLILMCCVIAFHINLPMISHGPHRVTYRGWTIRFLSILLTRRKTDL